MGMQNDHTWGDQWNGEDLSIFSVDDSALLSSPNMFENKYQDSMETASLNNTVSEMSTEAAKKVIATVAGNRAAEAFIRPAPIYTAGRILKYGFDLAKVVFQLTLEASESTKENAPTEVFVPQLHFPKDKLSVTVSGGKWEYNHIDNILRWWHNEGEQNIKIQGVKVLNVEVEDTNIGLQLCDKVCSVM